MNSSTGLKGGLAAIADKFKKLALVLDRGSDGSRRGSSVGNSTGSSTDGAGISISPVPTPKDGSSVGRAVAHKQHHGYLPTPTASMAGQFQRHLSLRAAATETEIQLPPAGNSNVPGSLLAPSTVAAAAAPAAPTAAVSAAASPPAALGLHQDGQCAGAAGLKAGEGDTADMPPLAPGAVPTFGGCGAPAVTRPGHAASASSVQDTPSAAVQGNSTARSGGVSEPLRLGPSSLPGPLLLAMSPHLPPALQRDHWCLVDFVVLKKLYDGYASLICKVRHLAASMGSSCVVAHSTCLPCNFWTWSSEASSGATWMVQHSSSYASACTPAQHSDQNVVLRPSWLHCRRVTASLAPLLP